MADNPLAIRVTENVKMLFNELAQSSEFENKGEFLERLLVQYQLETAKKQVPVMQPAIEATESLCSRLLEVLNGTAAAILTRDEKNNQELEDMKAQMQEYIVELERTRDEDAKRIEVFEVRQAELLDEINRLESTLADKDALLKAHKDSLDTQIKLDNLLSLLDTHGSRATDIIAGSDKVADKTAN